jgi:hypothetical protein
MRISVAAVSFVLIHANVVCASELLQKPSVAAEGAALVVRQAPVQNDRPIAAVISGEFFIYRTSEKLNCKAGLSWMTQLAEAGNAEAMFELGDLYKTGNCVLPSDPKALAWFLKAAEHGNAAAPSVLGKLYYSGGERIAPDYEEALRWLSNGVILLDPQAFYYLGLMYQQGIGVRPNYKEAYKLLDLSMHLFPFFSDNRKMALVARDSARESLTPREVVDETLASKRLLVALLEHDQQGADNLLPQEVLAALRGNNR